MQITSVPTDVLSGNTVQMQYQVRNANPDGQVRVTIAVTSGMSKCSGNCGQVDQVDGNGKTYQATFTAPNVDAGQTKSIPIKVTVNTQGEQPASDTVNVNVQGPDKPQTVTSISGKVKDSNGKAVAGADVAMKDSGGHPYQAKTNGSGGYSFNSSDSQPITPGNITVGALKEGYETATVTIQASAGKSAIANLTLKVLESTASASPSASVSASATTEATDEVTEEPTQEDSVAADPNTQKTASDQGGGSGSMLFIVLGGLLVAAGVGAIVLVLMRRKNNPEAGGGPEVDPTVMGGGPAGMVPPSQGRFNDATRVASPMGAGRDATMVAPRAASPMADAPTMLQRPVEDEFPDPYGAPVPHQGGQYGGGGWDNQAGVNGGQQYGGGNQYGEPTQYGRPQDNGQYGGGTSTYGAAAAAPVAGGTYGGQQYGGGQQQRYDEPTGMYRPEPGADDGYGAGQYGGGNYQAGGGYDQGVYGDQGGYDQGGYGDQGGYDQRAGGGTYGGGQYGGGQYGGGGYDDDHGGYGDQGGQQYGGGQYGGGQYGGGAGQQYGARNDGYDQGPAGYDDGAYDQRAGNRQPSHPGQRRPTEWDS
ncbi:carboxypeptidase-like regulatory domain-containing protein [Actinoplanes sp. CA-030573]|uniref:carboxypeptidase-like regulatory domain-containing protein n=1 Tax=Actinoplanes sp. CA-030573 TaxID=3239898 RepID=UPI003D8DEA65